MKKDAAKHFRDINCTLDDACSICYLEEKVSKPGPPSPPGGEKQEYRPVPCNSPLSCPATTTTTALPVPAKPDGSKPDGPPGKRKKREGGGPPGGGGGGGEGGSKQAYSSQAQVDFDSEANFIHQLMKVPPQYRFVQLMMRLLTFVIF